MISRRRRPEVALVRKNLDERARHLFHHAHAVVGGPVVNDDDLLG
jgi:hypothetical protein